ALADQPGRRGAADDRGQPQLVAAGDEDAGALAQDRQVVLAPAIGTALEIEVVDAPGLEPVEQVFVAFAGIGQLACGRDHRDAGVAAAAQLHEALEDAAPAFLVFRPADGDDPAAGFALGHLAGTHVLRVPCVLIGAVVQRSNIPRRTAAPSRTCHAPRASAWRTLPAWSSATRSASNPTPIRPLPGSRSSAAGLLVKAGSARSSGSPRASSAFKVSSNEPEWPTSMCAIRPSASKQGRQPPASELMLTRSAGASLSR